MATLILTAVGSALGGPIGGFIGNIAGGALDQAIFGSLGGNRNIEGSRLSDLSVQSSAYGQAVPLVYGTIRLPGNVVWSTGLIETQNEETEAVGSGKQRQSVTTTTYTYSSSFAVALSGRKIHDIGRVWADGKLLREANGTLAVPGEMRIYQGIPGHQIDPLLEAEEGVDSINAFRELAYVVFEDLQLAEYANRIPNLTFEIIADEGGTVFLSDIITDLCQRSDILAFDIEDLDRTVGGYIVPAAQSARQLLEGLAAVFHFDLVEQDQRLLFRPLERSESLSIDENDLAQLSSGTQSAVSDRLRTTRTQELELPQETRISYIDPERDYQSGLQRARRLTTLSKVTQERSIPIVLGASEAKEISEKMLDISWKSRDVFSFVLPQKFADLSPGDVINLTSGGQTNSILLKNIELVDQQLECQGIKYVRNLFQGAASPVPADTGALPVQEVLPLADTDYLLLDIPLINGDDVRQPLLFFAQQSSPSAPVNSSWPGAALFISRNAGEHFTRLASGAFEAIMGTVAVSLSNGPAHFWDEQNEILVELDHEDKVLESRSEADVLNGANIAWLGGEIIQFRSTVLEPDGRYRLSGLLRGRRGSESFISSHVADERFVLLTESSIASAGLRFDDIGQSHSFKAVTFGQPADQISDQSFLFAARNLKPLSPVHAAAERTISDDILIAWLRRSRVGAEWRDGVDIPLGEEAEQYHVDILDGGAVIRTLDLSEASLTYSAAQQIEDFGSVQASVAVRIYQVSSYVGRGWPLEVNL